MPRKKTAAQLQREISQALGSRNHHASKKLPTRSSGLTQAGELEDSFGSKSAATAFGEYLKGRLGTDYSVYPLVSTGGNETSWYRLAIEPRHVKRAEDLRDAWGAALDAAGGRRLL